MLLAVSVKNTELFKEYQPVTAVQISQRLLRSLRPSYRAPSHRYWPVRDVTVVQNGVVLTTPVIDNPHGGAFRNNRRPDVVSGIDPFLQTTDGASSCIPRHSRSSASLGTSADTRCMVTGLASSTLLCTSGSRSPSVRTSNSGPRSTTFSTKPISPIRLLCSRTPSVIDTPGCSWFVPAYTPAAAGGAFGILNSTVSKDVGLEAHRQIQFSLRYNF